MEEIAGQGMRKNRGGDLRIMEILLSSIKISRDIALQVRTLKREKSTPIFGENVFEFFKFLTVLFCLHLFFTFSVPP